MSHDFQRIALETLENRYLLSLPWGGNSIEVGQDTAAATYWYLTGSGQTAAVLDFGVDFNNVSLGGGEGPGFKIEYAQNFGNGSPTDGMDTEGHGTAIAGLIAADPFTYEGVYNQGVAPDASIVDLRQTNSAQIKLALDWVIANYKTYHIGAINLTDFEDTGAFNPTVYSSELQTLYNDNVLIVSPVGNGGASAEILYPAASPYDYGAGAVDSTDSIWEDPADNEGTQLGSQLSFLAPGVNVLTTAYDVPEQRSTYVNFATGTSFAAPYIVGTGLLLQQIDPAITPAQIATIIDQSGTPNVGSDGNTYYSLNIYNALTTAINEFDGGNNSMATATNLNLSSGSAAANNQYLIIQHDDYYKFTISTTENMTLGINYGGPSSQPTEQLLNQYGGLISNFNGSLGTQLAAGTYYIHLTNPTSLYGTFNVNVNATAPGSPSNFPGIGTTNSIAYDSSGNLYMAYFDQDSNSLMFAKRSLSGVWTTPQTIDSTAGAGTNLSLSVSPQGTVGVAYYTLSSPRLSYAVYNGSTWNITVVDSSRKTGQMPSLAFNSTGNPAISYYDKGTHSLNLATFSRHRWSITTVDSSGDSGHSSDLVLDPATSMWSIAYENNANGDLMYAQQGSNGWSFSTIDTGAYAANVSLAFNRRNTPGISYYDATTQSLKFAQLGRGWSVATVDGRRKRTIGQYSNLTFFGNTAEILYFNATQNALYSATGTIGSFSTQLIESNGGEDLTEARGGQGQQTIAYYDTDTDNLTIVDLES